MSPNTSSCYVSTAQSTRNHWTPAQAILLPLRIGRRLCQFSVCCYSRYQSQQQQPGVSFAPRLVPPLDSLTSSFHARTGSPSASPACASSLVSHNDGSVDSSSTTSASAPLQTTAFPALSSLDHTTAVSNAQSQSQQAEVASTRLPSQVADANDSSTTACDNASRGQASSTTPLSHIDGVPQPSETPISRGSALPPGHHVNGTSRSVEDLARTGDTAPNGPGVSPGQNLSAGDRRLLLISKMGYGQRQMDVPAAGQLLLELQADISGFSLKPACLLALSIGNMWKRVQETEGWSGGLNGPAGQLRQPCNSALDQIMKRYVELEQSGVSVEFGDAMRLLVGCVKARYQAPDHILDNLAGHLSTHIKRDAMAQRLLPRNFTSILWAYSRLHHKPLEGQLFADVITELTERKALRQLESRDLIDLLHVLVAVHYHVPKPFLDDIAHHLLLRLPALSPRQTSSMARGFGALAYDPLQGQLLEGLVDMAIQKKMMNDKHVWWLKDILWSAATVRHQLAPSFLDHMAHVMRDTLDQLEPQDVSHCMWGFAKMKHNPLGGSLMDAIIERMMAEDMENHKPLWLKNFLWSLSALDHTLPQDLAEKVGDVMLRRRGGFKAQEVSNTLWALAKANRDPCNGQLVDAFIQRMSRTEMLPHVTGQGAKDTLWAAATLRDSLPDYVSRQLLSRLRSILPDCQPQHISISLWALAKMGCKGEAVRQLWSGVAQHLAQDECARMKEFKPQEAKDVLWSAAVMSYPLPRELLVEVSVLIANNIAAADPVSTSISLWSFVKLGCNPLDGKLLDTLVTVLMSPRAEDTPGSLSGASEGSTDHSGSSNQLAHRTYISSPHDFLAVQWQASEMSRWSAKELKDVLWAAASLRHALPAQFMDLAAYHIIQKWSEVSPQTIGNAVWAFAKLHHQFKDDTFFEEISSRMESSPLLADSSILVLRDILWSAATLKRQLPASFLDAVAQLACERIAEFSTPQSITNFSWALARMKYTPLDGALLDGFVRHLESSPKLLAQFTPQQVSNYLWSMAVLNHKVPHCLLDELAGIMVNKLSLFSPQGLSNSLWGFAKLGYDPLNGEAIDTVCGFLLTQPAFVDDFSAQSAGILRWSFERLDRPLPVELDERLPGATST